MPQPLYITSLSNHQNNVRVYHSILNYVHSVTKNTIFTEARVLNVYCWTDSQLSLKFRDKVMNLCGLGPVYTIIFSIFFIFKAYILLWPMRFAAMEVWNILGSTYKIFITAQTSKRSPLPPYVRIRACFTAVSLTMLCPSELKIIIKLYSACKQ